MEMKPADDVVTMIMHEHAEVRNLLRSIGGAAANARQEGFDALTRLLDAHEGAEEQHIYTALQQLGGDAKKVADARLAEEEAAKQAIAKMKGMDCASAAFAQAFVGLRGDIEAHAAAEESEVLPWLSRLDEGQCQRIAQAFRQVEAMVPSTFG
jgi:hemerythrin superfamily protein